MVSTHGYFQARPSLGKPDTGGQVVFVIELSKALAKLGYKVDILTRKFGSFKKMEKINEKVQIIRFACGGNNFLPKEYLIENLPEFIEKALKYIKNNKLEYQFINSHYWDAGFVGEELRKKLGIPHLFTPHSLGIWKEKLMKRTLKVKGELFEQKYNFKQRNKKEKEIMEQCGIVIATTPEQKKIMQKDYGIKEGKIEIITPGFDPKKFRKTSKKSNLPSEFIFTAGRLARNKGYDLLIKATAYILKEMPEIKLVFAVGSRRFSQDETAQKRNLLKIAEKLGIENKIIFFNYVENLENFYSSAEVFVLSSTYEPFGMTAIEAMACKTPVVVSDKGGLKFFLKDKKEAMIADPFKTKEFAEKIMTVLKNQKLRNNLIKKGYEKAQKMFTWGSIVKKTLAVSNKLEKKNLLCADMDGTFIGHDKSMRKLIEVLNKNNFYLVFSTGRDLLKVNEFIKEKNIQIPHALISMVGTEIYVLKNGDLLWEKEWDKIISKDWNREKIKKTLEGTKELILQDKRWQTKNKLSYFLRKNSENVLKEIKRRMKKEKMKAKVIYSVDEFLDFLPEKSGKGKALEFLIKKMKIKKGNVIIAGNSGNDIDLFESGFKGIIVENAEKELKEYKGKNIYRAKGKYSGGIIEGLQKLAGQPAPVNNNN